MRRCTHVPPLRRQSSQPSIGSGSSVRWIWSRWLQVALIVSPRSVSRVVNPTWRSNDVGSLTSDLHISERQLRRRALAAIGLAPKLVQRILRFQRFLALAHAREELVDELALLAAGSGYADQPHLTRESLQLAGLSPRALLRESQESCFGLHDHATSWLPLLRARSH
jgi:AraC-like DNA-binding protein